MRIALANLTLALSALGSVLFSSDASAATLTGAFLFRSDALGNIDTTNLDGADTVGGNNTTNLYLAPNSLPITFLNSGNGPSTSLNTTLASGSNDLLLLVNGSLLAGEAGIYTLNLYFDGIGASPGISAVYNLTSDTFTGGAGVASPALGALVGSASAGGLTLTSGGSIITLSSLQIGPAGGNFVDIENNVPGSLNDDVIAFRLTVGDVNDVPEPGTLALAGIAAAALAGRRAARCARA